MRNLWKTEPVAVIGAIQAIFVAVMTVVHMDPAIKAPFEAALAACLAVLARSQVTPFVSPPALDPEPTAASGQPPAS